MLQIHLSHFVRKIICPVSKNVTILKNDFFILFNIGWPCKHYNFQTCLHDNLVPRMLEMAFQNFQISNFSGGACPQTPLVSYSSLTSCLLQILLKPLVMVERPCLWRQCGRVVRALDLKSIGRRFKSSSDC